MEGSLPDLSCYPTKEALSTLSSQGVEAVLVLPSCKGQSSVLAAPQPSSSRGLTLPCLACSTSTISHVTLPLPLLL